jgi:hypothetical protein
VAFHSSHHPRTLPSELARNEHMLRPLLSWMIWLVVPPVTSAAVANFGMFLCLFRGRRGDTASFVNRFLLRMKEGQGDWIGTVAFPRFQNLSMRLLNCIRCCNWYNLVML